MKKDERTRFHDLEERIKVDIFLAEAGKTSNDFARTVVESTYGIMRVIEWPEDMWTIETTLNGAPRHFFHERSTDLGVILMLTVAGVRLKVPFSMHEINKHPVYRFALDGNRLGDADPTDQGSLANLAKSFEDTIVEIASNGRHRAP